MLSKISAFVRSNFFVKTLFVFTAVLIVCVISVASILFHRLKAPLQASLETAQKTNLNQIATMSDAYILSQINNIIIHNIYQSEDEFMYFFSLSEIQTENTSELLRVYEKLSKLTTQFEIFHSFVIYNTRANIIISSDQGIALIQNKYNAAIHTPFNLDAINAVMASPKKSGWITDLQNGNSPGGTQMLSYICSVPITPVASAPQGCIIFNIPASTLTDYFNSASSTNGGEFLIANDEGRFIISSERVSGKYYDYIQAEPSIFQNADGITSFNGSSIIWRKSQINDWIYINILPLSSIFREIKLASQHTAVIVIIFIFTFGLLIYAITKWLHKPIRKLIDSVNTDGENGDDGFQAIESAIRNLSSRVVDLEGILEQNKDFIKNQIIADILYGNISGADEVKFRFSIVNMKFDYRHFTLIFTQFSNKLLKSIDYKQREFLFLQTSKQLEKYWGQFGGCISIRHNNCIILVLGHNTIEVLGNLILQNIDVGVDINIGICDTVTDLLDLHKSFDMLPVYQKYSFIYGYGNVFTQSEITSYENSRMEVYHAFYSDVEAMLKTGRIDELKERIHETVALIRNNGYSYDYTQNLLIQLVNTIGQASRDKNLISDRLLKSKLISDFNATETLAEFEDWIISLSDAYLQEFSQKNAAVQSTFIQSIVEYITNNITEDLTLKTVAAKFGISDGHLSRIFKEAYNINFSVFLNTKKFEAAASMLISNKVISVTEIAEKLSYYNMPYFNRQFKAKYGVSPLQYRKMH